MTKSQRAALAKFVMRAKEHLALIRPYGDVLMLHTMHYADEIRSSEDIDRGAKSSVGASELKLAERLINDLSKDKFEADKFEDTYREKILKVAEQKAARAEGHRSYRSQARQGDRSYECAERLAQDP
jgi:DNA end-binding protein Ku